MEDIIKIYETWHCYETPFKVVVNETKKKFEVINRNYTSKFKSALISRLTHSYKDVFADDISVLFFIGLENNKPTYILISNIIVKFTISENDRIASLHFDHHNQPYALDTNRNHYYLNTTYLNIVEGNPSLKNENDRIETVEFLYKPIFYLSEYEYYSYKPRIHYCGDEECEGDCGELACGCIDRCNCSQY